MKINENTVKEGLSKLMLFIVIDNQLHLVHTKDVQERTDFIDNKHYLVFEVDDTVLVSQEPLCSITTKGDKKCI